MKKIIPICVLAALLMLNACSKSSSNSDVQADPASGKPTASFDISNLVNGGKILEANINDFKNNSANADSYFWDFGNGVTSTEKVPTNISFVPCGGNYTITLKVSNRKGETATYAHAYEIQCRGRFAGSGKGHHEHVPLPVVHLSGTQLNAFQLN